MRRIAFVIVAVLLPFSFAACGATGPSGGFSEDSGESSVIPERDFYLKMTELDGVKCVIFKDYDMGGISCDWNVDESGE